MIESGTKGGSNATGRRLQDLLGCLEVTHAHWLLLFYKLVLRRLFVEIFFPRSVSVSLPRGGASSTHGIDKVQCRTAAVCWCCRVTPKSNEKSLDSALFGPYDARRCLVTETREPDDFLLSGLHCDPSNLPLLPSPMQRRMG